MGIDLNQTFYNDIIWVKKQINENTQQSCLRFVARKALLDHDLKHPKFCLQKVEYYRVQTFNILLSLPMSSLNNLRKERLKIVPDKTYMTGFFMAAMRVLLYKKSLNNRDLPNAIENIKWILNLVGVDLCLDVIYKNTNFQNRVVIKQALTKDWELQEDDYLKELVSRLAPTVKVL